MDQQEICIVSLPPDDIPLRELQGPRGRVNMPLDPPPSYSTVMRGRCSPKQNYRQGSDEAQFLGYSPRSDNRSDSANNRDIMVLVVPSSLGSIQGYNQPLSPGHPPQSAFDQSWANVSAEPAVHVDSSLDPEAQHNVSTSSDDEVKNTFMRKVYLIVAFQLFVVVCIAVLFTYESSIHYWIQNDGVTYYYAGYGIFAGSLLLVALPCDLRKHSPGNYIFLAAITFAMSWMIGTISSFHDTFAVINSAATTMLVCLSIAVLTLLKKMNTNTGTRLLVFIFLKVAVFTGLSALLVYNIPSLGQTLTCVWSGIGALFLSLYIMVVVICLTSGIGDEPVPCDGPGIGGCLLSWLALGSTSCTDTGKEEQEGEKSGIGPDEYLLAALQIYVDMTYLFLFIAGSVLLVVIAVGCMTVFIVGIVFYVPCYAYYDYYFE